MGLDQYAYARTKDTLASNENATIELAYWRKHPNLQGWMEQRWLKRLADEGVTPEESPYGSAFNGVEFELTEEDLLVLELDIISGNLPETKGFFFGNDSDEHYKEEDLEFVKEARANLFLGLKVFYNSSW
jgi:hypothetical protein